LLKGIGVGSLAKFEENVGPLLGGHLSLAPRVGGIGFLEATEDADHFRHIFYLRTGRSSPRKRAGIKAFPITGEARLGYADQ